MGDHLSASRRRALSVRQISREYGVGRSFVSELIYLGRLPALRRGRTLLVLREDFERVFRELAAESADDAERRVDEVLGREFGP